MNFLKKTLTSLLILTSLSTAGTFEQNGVKEGNNRVSASIRLTIPKEGDNGFQLLGQFGHFLSDDIEIMADIFSTKLTTKTGDRVTSYLLGIGGNYYFLKTPTLTPYVGGQYYRSGITENGNYNANGTRIYVGAHQFLSEKFAVTPEAGSMFFDFTEYSQSYLNVYLTYFFN